MARVTGGSSTYGGGLRAFGYSQFRLFWASSLISFISFFMVLIARGWLVLIRTDSPFQVTAVSAVQMLPIVVFSALGGVIADRLDRKTIIVVAETANFAILFALAILLVTENLEVWHIYVLSVLSGTGFALSMPARNALVPRLVSRQDMASGVALFSLIFSASQLVGPAFAGVLIEWRGMGTTFMVSSLLVIPALAVLFRLRIPEIDGVTESRPRVSVLRNMAEGVAYVRQRAVLVGLMLMGLVATVFAIPYQTILPVFARDVLDSGAAGLGILGAGAGAGGIVGAFAVAFFSKPQQLKNLLIVGGLSFGFVVLLFAVSTDFWLSLALVIIVGFMMQVFLTANNALVQLSCPDYIRGRVLGIRMIIVGVSPVGMLLLGLGAEVVGPRLSLALMSGIGLALMAVLVMCIADLRRAERAVEAQSTSIAEAS